MPHVTVGLPNHGDYFGDDPWRALVELAVHAEEAGVDAVSTVDHVVMSGDLSAYPYGTFPGDPSAAWLDPLTVLAVIAGATSRISLRTGVLISPLRPAALLAKMTATLDVLSGGRLVLGVGTGWQAAEYAAAGVEWSRRGQIFDDQLAALRALWSEGPTSFVSETLVLDEVFCYPKPLRESGGPLWIGGALSSRNLDRIVRWGSGWIRSQTADAEVVADGVTALRAALDHAGRDSRSVRVRVSPQPVWGGRRPAGPRGLDAGRGSAARGRRHRRVRPAPFVVSRRCRGPCVPAAAGPGRRRAGLSRSRRRALRQALSPGACIARARSLCGRPGSCGRSSEASPGSCAQRTSPRRPQRLVG
jgi:probable F420-dependent oxidoreductase